jgi:hypothetical protein
MDYSTPEELAYINADPVRKGAAADLFGGLYSDEARALVLDPNLSPTLAMYFMRRCAHVNPGAFESSEPFDVMAVRGIKLERQAVAPENAGEIVRHRSRRGAKWAMRGVVAATRAMGALAFGVGQVPEDVRRERIAQCKACDRFVRRTSQCDVCGCLVALKVQRGEERCPLDPPKWREHGVPDGA